LAAKGILSLSKDRVAQLMVGSLVRV